MKLRLCLFLAAISAVLVALPAGTARRPRYGGNLRLEIAAAVNSLDPAIAALDPEIAATKDHLEALVHPVRGAEGLFSGSARTGPFRITEWEPGKQVKLAANDDYAGGRPFLDSIEIQMGRSAKDRLVDLELGKTDLIEIPAEQARQAAQRGVRLSSSQPDELLAVVFDLGRSLTEDSRVREAVARAVDRAAITNFILQKEGEPAGGLLPQWSSGTAFLFPTAADPSGAKEQWLRITGSATIFLGYDSGDALEQRIAERIVVDAREAGIPMATATMAGASPSSTKADARLIRVRMVSSLPRVALASLFVQLGPLAGIDASPLPDPASAEQIYERERAMARSYRVMPVVWLPQVYGLGAQVRDWKAPGPGENWPLADVGLDERGATSRSQ